jgi:hypothetical protein
VTTTAGVIGEFILVVDGCPVNANTVAIPGVTITLAVCVMVTLLATAVTVFVSATVELKVLEVWPLAPVVPGGGSVLPVPVGVKVTVAPLTRFPNASFTVTVSVAALEPELAVIVPGVAVRVDWLALGAPAAPVAVNVTGLPVRLPDVAVRVFVPATVPRVQEVRAALPVLPVVTGLVGVTLPPPAVTVNVTATPATGLPLASFTTTAGGEPTALPAVPGCVVRLVAAIDAAAPALRVIVPEGTLVSPEAPKLSV